MLEGGLKRENRENNFRNVGSMEIRGGNLTEGTGLNLRWQMGNNVDGPKWEDWERGREKSTAVSQQWTGKIGMLEYTRE